MKTALICNLCESDLVDLGACTVCPHCDTPCRPEHSKHCRPGETPCTCCDLCTRVRHTVPKGA